MQGRDVARRHLTLITGHNGAGKSTLFLALKLGLHGSLALGDRVSQHEYNDFLLTLFHNRRVNRKSSTAKDAEVGISFQYVQSGEPHRIIINRHWRRKGEKVQETLTVLKDGVPPIVDPPEYQHWLNDLVPPSHSHISFFDAEQLSEWTKAGTKNPLIASAIRRLLNLHLVDRLRSDLNYYTHQRGGGQNIEKLRRALIQYQSNLDDLSLELAELEAAFEELTGKETRIRARLLEKERQIAEEGGAFAARRPYIRNRLIDIEAEIQEIETDLRDLCAELLPFTIVPELVTRLQEKLRFEREAMRGLIARQVLQEQFSALRSNHRDNEVWRGLDVRRKDRDTILKRIEDALKDLQGYEQASLRDFIHQLSQADHEKLEAWISESLFATPDKSRVLTDRLKALQAERHAVKEDMRRAPDDEVLVPHYQEIRELECSINEVQERQSALNQEIGALRFQIEEVKRQLKRAHENFVEAQANERELALAHKSRLVLQAYRDILLRQRITMLEKELVASFNAICRKGSLLASVSINPETYSVHLETTDGRRNGLQELSAGERQIFALSLLSSMRKTSGQRLPLVIDTPLARLDDLHRGRFIEEFFPSLGDQLVLFTTDAEMNEELLGKTEPYLARNYQLVYCGEIQETKVHVEGEAALGGLILHNLPAGSMDEPLTLNADLWTIGPTTGGIADELKRCLLPGYANRLVLTDPETCEYDWKMISELERVVDDSTITTRLRDGTSLHELWSEEWVYSALRAGYDSISVSSPRGHEEYVLNPAVLIPIEPSPEESLRDVI